MMKTTETRACTWAAWLLLAGAAAAQSDTILFEPVPRPENLHGASLALDGEWLVVGEPAESQDAGGGRAWLYRQHGSEWRLERELASGEQRGNELQGLRVALDDDLLLVARPYDHDVGWRAGSILVYRLGPAGWSREAELHSPLGLDSFAFGYRLATSAERIFASSFTGVEIYERGPSGWHLADQIDVSYHRDLVADGETLVVSDQTASIRIYELGPGGWGLRAHFRTNGGSFPYVTLALDADLLAVGVRAAEEVQLYERVAGNWQAAGVLHPSAPWSGAGFGRAIALDGPRLCVSTGDGYDFDSAQSVEVFERDAGGTFRFTRRLYSGATYNGEFGISLALDGERLAVGAPAELSVDRGSAQLFELEDDFARSSCVCAQGPCGNAGPGAGCVNGILRSARITSHGSPRVARDDLTLVAAGMPPNVACFFFMGPQLGARRVFGAGLSCVRGGARGVFRYPLRASDGNGTAPLGPGIVAASQAFGTAGGIAGGETWSFQLWYRDPLSMCAGFNLTSALSIDFR